MSRSSWVLKSSLLLLALAAPAHAVEFRLLGEPLRLDITESLYLNYHGDPGNGDPAAVNYEELMSRLNVQLAWRRWLVGVRWDAAAYPLSIPQVGDTATKAGCLDSNGQLLMPPPASDCVGKLEKNRFSPEGTLLNQGFPRFRQSLYDPRKVFEKFYLSYSSRTFDATFGDFYVNFGRGLVLSLRKVDELGVDTTLLGGKVALHAGDLSAVAVAGWTNIQNVDETTATYIGDPYDFITGAHLDLRATGGTLVGGHVVYGQPNPCPVRNPDGAQPSCNEPQQSDYYLRSGATLDVPKLLPWLSLYGEYARASDRIATKEKSGDAIYGAATAYLGRAVWLLEFKDYRSYRPWHSRNDPFGSLVYMQPPTLERFQTQLSSNSDIVAARLRVDLRVNSSLLLYASAELGRLTPAEGITDTLYDFYAAAQLRWNQGRSHLFPLAGFRLEHDDTDHKIEEQLVATEWDAAQMIGGGWSVETQGLIWLRQKGDERVAGSGDNQWREGNLYVSLKSPAFALSRHLRQTRFLLIGGYEFTTALLEEHNRHNFFNGALQWNITPDTSLQLFAGGQRAGLKCISGVCRYFPAFEGAKLILVFRL